MATKKRNQPREKIDYKNWVWCIDNLTSDQMKAFDDSPPSSDELVNGLHRVLEMGFKITLKPDTFNNCLQINAVCDETGHENSGLAVSARSDDTEDMVGLLLYKIFVVADGNLQQFADKKPRGIRG